MVQIPEGIKSFLWDMYTAGRRELYGRFDLEPIWRTVLLNITFTIGILCLVVFGSLAFHWRQNSLGLVDYGVALLLLVSALYLRWRKRYLVSSYLSLTLMTVYFLYLIAVTGMKGGGFMWSFTYPLFSVIVLGIRRGSLFCLFFLIGVMLNILIPGLPLQGQIFDKPFLYRYLGSFGAVYGLANFFEYIRFKSQQQLNHKNSELQSLVVQLQSATAALRESEQKYRLLVERASDGIAIVHDWVFRYVNPQLAELLGYPAEELIGTPVDRYLAPEQSTVIRTLYDRRSRAEGISYRFETILIDRRGQRVFVELSAGTISYAGQPADLVIVRDIRRNKQREAERVKSSKMEVARDLAAGITHDFNNLLTVIMGGMTQIQPALPAEEKMLRTAKKIEDAAEKASELIKQFFLFSRNDLPVKRKESIADIVRYACQATVKNPRVSCRYDFPDDLWPVECDRDQLEQAISCLLANAREAMAGEGTIQLSARNMTLDVDQFPDLPAGKYVAVIVQDQGKGIAPENLERVFDPYFSTKNKVTQKGVGLGLAIVNAIVSRHDGIVHLSSELGQGTKVEFCLPAAVP